MRGFDFYLGLASLAAIYAAIGVLIVAEAAIGRAKGFDRADYVFLTLWVFAGLGIYYCGKHLVKHR